MMTEQHLPLNIALIAKKLSKLSTKCTSGQITTSILLIKRNWTLKTCSPSVIIKTLKNYASKQKMIKTSWCWVADLQRMLNKGIPNCLLVTTPQNTSHYLTLKTVTNIITSPTIVATKQQNPMFPYNNRNSCNSKSNSSNALTWATLGEVEGTIHRSVTLSSNGLARPIRPPLKKMQTQTLIKIKSVMVLVMMMKKKHMVISIIKIIAMLVTLKSSIKDNKKSSFMSSFVITTMLALLLTCCCYKSRRDKNSNSVGEDTSKKR